MTEKLLVPDIGEFEGVEVIEILVQEGQEIKKNDPIVTIETVSYTHLTLPTKA